jgi:hypothetical protein
MSKANALIYTVSFGESKRLFESTAARCHSVAPSLASEATEVRANRQAS